MNSLKHVKRAFTTKVVVDEQCLPLKPTWSINSLLKTKCQDITDKEFKHLLNLSRIHVDDQEKLKKEINTLQQFTENIKSLDQTDIQPLTHIWKENDTLLLRDDNDIEIDSQLRGRDLLSYAKKKSGHFYTVKGNIPSSE